MTTTIAKVQFPAWKESVEKINARATRLRFNGGITYEIVGEKMVSDIVAGFRTTYRAYEVAVTVNTPHYQGWDVVAVAKTDSDTGITTFHSMPGYSEMVDIDSYRHGECDQCNLRRKRNQVIFVFNETTGDLMQVGGSCVKDFMGWKPTMARLDLLLGLAVMLEPVRAGRETFDPLTVLAVAHDVVAGYGYVSRADATEFQVPTATRVRECLADESYRCGIDADKAWSLAEGTREWVLSEVNAENTSEYMANLREVAASEEIGERHVGILASAVAAQYRAEKRDAEKQAVRDVSDWVGVVKERRDFELTVDGIRTISTEYGLTTIYSLSDLDGNRFKWFASRAALGEYEGVTVTVKATVKDHREWDGIKETHLTRAKLVRGTVTGFDVDPRICGGREREYSVGV